MDIIENLKWRYATKRFDPNKKLKTQDVERLKEVIRLSASSYGLQLYKVLVITDPEIREKLREAAWGQSQVTDSSHLFVFCTYTADFPAQIDSIQEVRAEVQNTPPDRIEAYKSFVMQKIEEMEPAERKNWTAKQTYIALGNLLAACAEFRVDSCPMEGFEPKKFDEILGLKEQGLTSAVFACVGYRDESDRAQHQAKVRRSKDMLFEEI